MKTKYKEIFKLKRMLEKEGIPFDWIEHNGYSKEQIEALKSIAPDIWEKYHICYPKGSFTNWGRPLDKRYRRVWYIWSRRRQIRNNGWTYTMGKICFW